MINLDKTEEFKKLDTDDVLGSVRAFPDQVEHAWQSMKEVDIPDHCSTAKQVVVAGMGGSALGGRMVDALSEQKIRVPIEVFTQVYVPNYVNKDTLVLACSYSGNTEETISATRHAYQKGANIFVITTGGKLKKFMEDHKLPGYVIDPKFNPSGQPRLALGYMATATLALLAKCNFISMTDEEMVTTIKEIRKFATDYGPATGENENLAKKMAKALKNKMPVLVASEHLVGAAHAFKNQLNESAKSFSTLFELPELNHHLMEGLKNPAEARSLLYFLFFESELYNELVRVRYPITAEVVGKNDVLHSTYEMRGSTKLAQAFELLTFGSFVQFYLAMLYGLNPSRIPWVDYFKKNL